jgi:hypothetical protein
LKVVHREILIDNGGFVLKDEFNKCYKDIVDAVSMVVWPPGSSQFTINPTRQGNGVKPIKAAFVDHLVSRGWQKERPLDLDNDKKPGPIDATYKIGTQFVAVEWETGNISSSHRALNKMTIGLLNKILLGGVLVLPTRNLYQYLTDRIGNYAELEPYFDVWRSIICESGVLIVVAVEHDNVNNSIPLIPKGTDGRALR